MSYLRPTDRLLLPAVRAALDSLPPDATTDADQAARALALAYARTIDEAAMLHHVAEVLVEESDEDYGGSRRLDLLLKATENKAVLADLGPKLLAVLTSLGATPAARAGQSTGKLPARPAGALAALRAARAE